MNLTYLSVIILCVALSTGAQLILKAGANRINENLASAKGAGAIFWTLLNMPIIVGMCIYVVSAITWIWILTKVDISIAYPFISLGFIMTLVFGWWVFDESLTTAKIIGTFLIVLGCIFITRS